MKCILGARCAVSSFLILPYRQTVVAMSVLSRREMVLTPCSASCSSRLLFTTKVHLPQCSERSSTWTGHIAFVRNVCSQPGRMKITDTLETNSVVIEHENSALPMLISRYWTRFWGSGIQFCATVIRIWEPKQRLVRWWNCVKCPHLSSLHTKLIRSVKLSCVLSFWITPQFLAHHRAAVNHSH